jgi:hypothetical protein
VRDGHGQVDVAHTLAPDDGARDFHAALLADDALVPDALVLAAEALEVLGRSEDALAEEAVGLRALRAVVDRFGLGHLAPRPHEDVIGTGDGEGDGVEAVGGGGGGGRHGTGRRRSKIGYFVISLIRYFV